MVQILIPPYLPYPIPEDGKGYICICPYIFNDLRFCLKRKIFKVILLALSVGLVCIQNKALWEK